MMTTVDLRLTFLSDWAIGSGHARHDALDFLVRRDADGLPYVPGKTLRGIWRDAAEQVALGLDGGTPGPWSDWRRFLWGDAPPSPRVDGVLEVPSAYVPEPVRSVLLSDPDLRRAAVVTRAATALEPATGIAKDHTLRIEERARAGSELFSSPLLDLAPPAGRELTDAWPAFFLLLAGARSMDRVGGRRRSGAGRCALDVVGGPLAGRWEEFLERARSWHRAGNGLPKPPSGGREALGASSSLFHAPGRSRDSWRRLMVRLSTLDPVLVGARVLGNAVLSHPVIPGATLLPVVTQALGVQATSLIRADALVVTDATPIEAGDAERSLPTPQPLRTPKVLAPGEPRVLVNEMLTTLVDDDGALRQTRALGGFVASGDRTAVSPRVARLVTTVHNVIDDDTQRPGLNGLYSYEALAPDQELACEVFAPPDAAGALATSLPGEVRLGGSRSAEYGRVRITSVEDRGPVTPAVRPGLAAGQPVALWLTSDAIPAGAPTPAGLLADLGEAWGTAVHLADDVDRQTVFMRTVRRESWQARWGLPRPSLVGVAGGSCLLVRPEAEVSADMVAHVEVEGIGQRRAEGFGRVLVDPAILRQEQIELASSAGSTPAGGGRGRSSLAANQARGGREPQWLTATRRAAVDSLLADAALVAARRAARLPQSLTRAQVGGLRAAADELADGYGAFESWLAGITASTARTAQWGETVGWLRGLLSAEDEVWDELGGGKREQAEALLGPLLTKAASKALRRDAIRVVLLAAVQAHRVGAAQAGTEDEGEGAA